MTKKAFLLLGFVMVFVITIVGCPVSGSMSISSGYHIQNNPDYVPLSESDSDFLNAELQKITATTTLIPYYYPGNDLAHVTKTSFLDWFNKFVKSSGLENNVTIAFMTHQMRFGAFFPWDQINVTFATLGYKLIFNESDNAGTKSTSDNSIVSGNNTSTGKNDISITFDPTCTGDNCYQGNGITGSGNSGNTPTPPQPQPP